MRFRCAVTLERARKRIYAELADTSIPTGTFQTRMLVTLCFMNWIAADLPALRLAAKQYVELGAGDRSGAL